jgi:hypothetical protein
MSLASAIHAERRRLTGGPFVSLPGCPAGSGSRWSSWRRRCWHGRLVAPPGPTEADAGAHHSARRSGRWCFVSLRRTRTGPISGSRRARRRRPEHGSPPCPAIIGWSRLPRGTRRGGGTS